jgi:hypothetical protein
MEKYFAMCHGWMRFMDENMDANDNGWVFSWTFTIGYIPNKIQKKMLIYCEQFITCSNYTWISNPITTKYIPILQHPNHIKFETKSNSVAHKPIDPPRGMCQFKHYLSTTKRYVTIRNWDNINRLRNTLPF